MNIQATTARSQRIQVEPIRTGSAICCQDEKLKMIIGKMSPKQKIGATITFGMFGSVITPDLLDAIEDLHCSGLRITPFARMTCNYIDPATGQITVKMESDKGFKKGTSAPYCSPEKLTEILNRLQIIASKRPLAIPLHFSFDQEGGSSADFRMGGVHIFPKPMGIRATNNPKYAYQSALATAKQARAVGLNWIHSPVLDININPMNPEIGTRSYSDNPLEVLEYAREALKGYKDGGVIATAKHFPGRGDSDQDAHYHLPILDISRKTLNERELFPYTQLIAEGLIPAIMLAHNIYTALDTELIATLSKKIITDLLRNELGFNGVITTDSMTMTALAKQYGVAQGCAMALAAGADLVLMKAEGSLRKETFDTIERFVNDGLITEQELDKKILRVLKVKHQHNIISQSSETISEILSNPKIKMLEQEIAQKSVSVLRDNGKLLTLSTDEPILLIEQATDTANDIWWHTGMLSENCQKYNRQVRLIETSLQWDDDDWTRIKRAMTNFKTIIITSYFRRGIVSNINKIEELLKTHNRVVIISNSPYPLTVPKNAGTVILTYATSPCNIQSVANILFGKN